MALDKDTLVKHHFWILAGTAALLALVGWVLVLLTGPASAGDPKKIEAAWKQQMKYSDFKSKEYIDDKSREAEKLKQESTEVFTKLYDSQEATGILMTWPKGMVEKGFDIKNGKFAYEVTIHPAKNAPKEKDSSTQMSGKLVRTDQEYFLVQQGEAEPVKFLRTNKPKITDGSTSVEFGGLGKYKDRLVTVKYVVGKYFGDEFTDNEKQLYRDTYRSEKYPLYRANYEKEQISEGLATVGPVNYLGQPVVLFRHISKSPDKDKEDGHIIDAFNETWVYQKNMPPPYGNRFFPFANCKREFWSEQPKDIESEEIWAAQEGFWVQREMFRQIKAANDSVAMGVPVKDASPNTFRNFYWETEFTITDNGVKAKVTNLQPKAQAIDKVRFLLRFKDEKGLAMEPVIFPPDGSPIFKVPTIGPAKSVNDSFTTKDFVHLKGSNSNGIHSVEQILTVETAAVKRIDVVAVGGASNGDIAVGHRVANKALLPFDKTKRPPPPKPAVDPQLPDPVDPNQPPPPPPPPDTSIQFSKRNSVIVDRYLEVTQELREVPVNLVLVIGPEHISRVEAALISSPLRFLPVQVMWHRIMMTLDGPDPTKASNRVVQENLELVIYGVVTLYTRPGRPAFAK